MYCFVFSYLIGWGFPANWVESSSNQIVQGFQGIGSAGLFELQAIGSVGGFNQIKLHEKKKKNNNNNNKDKKHNKKKKKKKEKKKKTHGKLQEGSRPGNVVHCDVNTC